MMSSTPASRPAPTGAPRAIFLASLGGALEFYDFILYGVFATYLGAAFFPAADPLVSLAQSFGVFAGGYLARPLGGLVFGHFGDRLGRRRVLLISILMMSISTAAMGLLPTYASIGPAASVGLILLRLLQGFALGGELPGAITYVVEAVPARRGLACGVIIMFVNLGVVLAALVSLLIHAGLSSAEVSSWGWRIGFLLGGLLGLVSFWLRLSLEESREFARLDLDRPGVPLVELLRRHPGRLVTGVAALATMAGFNGLLFAHMPSYLTQVLAYPAFDAAAAQNICLAVLSVGLVSVAWAGDYIDRRLLLAVGSISFVLLAWPLYVGLRDHPNHYGLLMVGAALAASLGNGTFAAILADLFPTHLRLSGIAAALNLSTTLLSATAPLIATSLIAATGLTQAPALVLIACGMLSLLSLIGLRRYLGPPGATR